MRGSMQDLADNIIEKQGMNTPMKGKEDMDRVEDKGNMDMMKENMQKMMDQMKSMMQSMEQMMGMMGGE